MTKKNAVDRPVRWVPAVMAMILSGWIAPPCLAQPPVDDQSSGRPLQPCVLLQNDNVLFGRAYQMGEYVIVQTGHGGELQLSRKEVSCWAQSLLDLYRYRVDRRQPGDLAALIRDARWCLQFDLYDLASREIAAVQSIDPGNLAAKSLQKQLTLLTESPATTTALPAPPVRPVGYQDEHVDNVVGSVDLHSLRSFTSHIQPMFFNRCGRCHSVDSPTAWKLVIPSHGARASSRISHTNLSSSLPFLDRTSPANSELFVKATTPHGGAEAPLSPRNAKAIELLKRWITMTVDAMPAAGGEYRQPDQTPAATAPPAQVPLPDTAESNATESNATGANATGANANGAIAAGPSATGEVSAAVRDPAMRTSGQPARLPQVENPFDPDLFNRRFHPDTR